MRIMLLATAYNGLCQRSHIEMEKLGHQVSVVLVETGTHIAEMVSAARPELIVCPFLKARIPAAVYEKYTCLVVHPGIVGDRGSSSLDWAILGAEEQWGVTVIQAAEEMDGGDIWAARTFPTRFASKSSLYRTEVTQAAVECLLEAVQKVAAKTVAPTSLASFHQAAGQVRPTMRQSDRAINWARDTTATIIRTIHAGDSAPGVLDVIAGAEFHLFGAHPEDTLRAGRPGEIIATRDGAICRATVDGAVWISHLRRRARPASTSDADAWPLKLPATRLLHEVVSGVPEVPLDALPMDRRNTFREIWYEEHNAVGYLHFDFHNGAMSTDQCHRLQESYRLALERDTKVLVLLGGREFWSNGIHLNIIEAAVDAADESWRNINAIDDVVLQIITTQDRLTVSALRGGAGAGGAMMALAADQVWARNGCVLNPHYRGMGLHGSEYWTYLLPKRVGARTAAELTQRLRPVGMDQAGQIGLVDDILPNSAAAFDARLRAGAEALAAATDYESRLDTKRQERARDEQIRSLQHYREDELAQMRTDFYSPTSNYHQARRRFVRKIRAAGPPTCLAVGAPDPAVITLADPAVPAAGGRRH